MALTRLPDLLVGMVQEQSREDTISFLLLLSSLIFAAFYWIETRFFIHAQYEFDSLAKKSIEDNPEGVRLPLAVFLLGTLFMMALATGILEFASYEKLMLFLYFNAAFWFCDFLGAFVIRRAYRPHHKSAAKAESDNPSVHEWYVGHTSTWFFPLYGFLNFLFFAALIVLYSQSKSDLVAIITALVILTLTLFRHLFWRTTLLEWSTKKALSQNAT